MIPCKYYIKRKQRFCSHTVLSSSHEGFCALHQIESLAKSKVADEYARTRFECRQVLTELVESIDEMNTYEQTNHGAKRRKRNKRISAPGRMANPHSLLLTPKIETSIDWTSIYSNTLYPLHVDVGCARGRFLVNLANKAPKQVWNHLGVEIRPDIVKESLVSLHKDQKAGVTQQNIHFMAFNFAVSAEDFFRTLPVETVRLVSFQFPDPWRKKKYLSRRIIQPDLLDTIAQYLYMRGFIYVSSDSRHLAIHMKSVLLGHDRFQMMEEDPLQTESVRAEWLQGGLSLSAGSTSSEVKRDCSEAEVIEEEVGDDLDGEVLEDDGRGWLSFNPLGEPSERELVCEKTWKPVWRLVFQKIR